MNKHIFFKLIHCINDILVSVGYPDPLGTDSVSNPNAVRTDISRTFSDMYAKNGRLAFPRKEINIYPLKKISILKKK